MKKEYRIAVCVCSLLTICCSLQLHAKIWRLNNTGLQADFTTVQAAHDHSNVQPGDTLHLEPSATSYGNLLNMNKRLTIISTGSNLDENPGEQFSKNAGFIGDLSFLNGARGAAGSVFHCNFNAGITLGHDSIRFERCNMLPDVNNSLSVLSGTKNVSIINCQLNSLSIANTANLIVSNNIIRRYINMGNSSQASGTVIVNNVINTVSASATYYITNAVFRNNIIARAQSYTFTNCTVENNLSANNTLPAGNGNQTSITMTNVFVNATGTADKDFILSSIAGNPAKNAGVGGVDCGAFGGSSPYKLATQPAIPAIYELVVPPTASGNTLNISFSTKSNN